MQKFIIQITDQDFSLINDENLECFIVSSNLPPAFIAQFADKAKSAGKIVLAEDVQICRAQRLDGILADFSKSENIAADFHALSEGLKGKYIGIICRNRRHESMLISECEPDFVVFQAWYDGQDKVKELTQWYAEMFLLQSALLPREDGVDFSSFQTDFVILSDTKYKIFVAKS